MNEVSMYLTYKNISDETDVLSDVSLNMFLLNFKRKKKKNPNLSIHTS